MIPERTKQQHKRGTKPVQIAAAERAEKLIVATSPVNTGFVGNLPNQARGIVQGLGALDDAQIKQRKIQDDARKEQDIRDAVEDSQKGVRQDNRSKDYADQYSASAGAVAGHDSLANATAYVEENKNNGWTLEQMQAGLEAEHAKSMQGSEDQLYNINANDIFQKGTRGLLSAYASHNIDTTQANKLQNINTDFTARIDKSETPEQVAGIFNAKFIEYTAAGLTNVEAADELYMSVQRQAEASGRPELLSALQFVETPNGPLLNIPKYRDQAVDAIAGIESGIQTGIDAENKKIMRQNDVLYSGMIFNGQRLPAIQMFQQFASGQLSAPMMTKLLSQQQKSFEKNEAANNRIQHYMAGDMHLLSKKDIWEVQTKILDNEQPSNQEISRIIVDGGTMPRETLRGLNNASINNEDEYKKANQAFNDINNDPVASRYMRSEMDQDRVAEFESYNFATKFLQLDHEAANAYLQEWAGRDISDIMTTKVVKELNAQVVEVLQDEDLGGASRTIRDNTQRMAHLLTMSGITDTQEAAQQAAAHVKLITSIVHTSPLPVSAVPQGVNMEDSLNRFFKSERWSELLDAERSVNNNSVVNLPEVREADGFKDFTMTVDPNDPTRVNLFKPEYPYTPVTNFSLHALAEEDRVATRTEEAEAITLERNIRSRQRILTAKENTDRMLKRIQEGSRGNNRSPLVEPFVPPKDQKATTEANIQRIKEK